ncbi:MAG TPA: sulfatase [Opitutae bacterium]|nr:sulfatase [Opitutae bacterium]
MSKDYEDLCTGHSDAFGVSRREFLNRVGLGLGGIALSQLLGSNSLQASSDTPFLSAPHFVPKAKRVIFLFQSGGPSQLDLFDYKPLLNERHGEQLPESVRQGQRLTGMSGNQSSIPLVGSPYTFKQHGESGHWMSNLMPYTAQISDEICMVKSLYTDAINHGPATVFMQSGSQLDGRPSIGSWVDYGLGRDNENLPSFVVLTTKNKKGQPLKTGLWGSGFLPTKHQGIRFRASADPVLYLNNPAGVDEKSRRMMLHRLRELHEHQFKGTPDESIQARISQYEMAFRMQASVPEATNMRDEPDFVFDEYGPDSREPGTFAANCIQARRLAERGVKFIQLYHKGWDQHNNLMERLEQQCLETDQASAALVKDLKRRGMLEDTLVIWGGEFGRTNYSQGKLIPETFGRDHHPRCFSFWMAGGGVKAGHTYGETCPFGYNVVKDPMHIHDFHATLLYLLGIDHEQLTYKFQGRRFRLTDVHGQVAKDILA